MRLRLIIILASFCLSRSLFAQEAGSEELFREALICYGEINFQCTLEKLEAARRLESAGSKDTRLLIEIHRYTAYSRVALGDESGALNSFRSIFRLKSDFYLSTDKVSPKIHRLYLQAKQEAEAEAETEAEAEVKEETEPESETRAVVTEEEKSDMQTEGRDTKQDAVLRETAVEGDWPMPKWIAGLDGSAAFLTGKDGNYYHVGFLLEAFAEAALGEGLYIGGGVIYQRHDGKSEAGDLNVLGATLRPAWTLGVGRFLLNIPVELGPVTYGRGNITDGQGIIWRVDPGFFVRLNRLFAVGAVVGPGGVFLLDQAAASWFVTTGVAIVGTW